MPTEIEKKLDAIVKAGTPAIGLKENNESICPDGIGHYQHFQSGYSIYYHPDTGAHLVYGIIRAKWSKLGWEKSPLGYPTTDESDLVSGKGNRYNNFQHGVICWKNGAIEAFAILYGPIYDEYAQQGLDSGNLGLPATDQMDMPDPNSKGKYQVFEMGSINWTPDNGAVIEHIILNLLQPLSFQTQQVTFVKSTSLWILSDLGKNVGLKASSLVGNLILTKNVLLASAPKESTDSILSILEHHSAFNSGKDWLPAGSIVYLDQFKKGNDFNVNLSIETAAILVAGLQAISSQKTTNLNYYESLLMIAAGADQHSLGLRKLITDSIPNWKPVLPALDKLPAFIIPGNELGCVAGLRTGLLVAGGQLSAAAAIKPPDVNTISITRIQPNSGGCGTPVAVFGNFPATKPDMAFVGFTGQDGKAILVPIDATQWSVSRIDSITPENVGDGPVGIVTLFGQPDQGNPAAASQFYEALAGCLGAGAYQIAGSLSRQVWASSQQNVPTIPVNPGNSNLFHGGPLLLSVVSTQIYDTDHIKVKGLNLLPGDTVYVDGKRCNSTLTGDILDGNTTGVGMRGGICVVSILRGPCSSQKGSVRMLPRVDKLRTPRGAPGTYIIFDGACFSESEITATFNGLQSPLVKLETAGNGSCIHVVVPGNIIPTLGNADGDRCQVILFDRGNQMANGSFTLILETFRIVILGDSIMWGQGLLEGQKFTELVGQRLAPFSRGSTVYRQDRSANSGAKIMNATGESDFNCGASPAVFDVAPVGAPINFQGEKNCGASSIANQVNEWSKLSLDVRNRVNLVMIDGGINDLGVMTLLDIFMTDAALTAQIDLNFNRMGDILLASNSTTSVLQVFPKATIVVTGYYPIVSMNTDGLLLITLLNILGFIPGAGSIVTVVLAGILKKRLSDMSSLFANRANNILSNAVKATKDLRVRFAIPDWNDDNCLFAPNAFIFGYNLFPPYPEDPVGPNRLALCGTPCLNSGQPPSLLCGAASLGHPNVKGALAYADAIMKVL